MLASTPDLSPGRPPSNSEEAQSATEDELVRVTQHLQVKEEGACLATPQAPPHNTSASEFISSLKVRRSEWWEGSWENEGLEGNIIL